MAAPSAAQPPRTSAWRRTPAAPIVGLLSDPAATLARLYATRGALKLTGLPAISGVFIAYTVAKGFALGDRFGFAMTAAGVVFVGALLGIIVLWFAGTVSMWTAPDEATEAEEVERGYMFVLFSYATLPFLPLLLIVVPIDLYFHGSAVFSAAAAPVPAIVAWLLRALILGTLVLWAVLMVRGTAAVRQESERAAARDLLRWAVELIVVAVLFAIALGASMMYW